MPAPLYLNHARTSWPKAPEVVAAMRAEVDALGDAEADGPDRTKPRVAAARGSVARFVGAPSPDRVTFCGSSTEGINTALKGLLEAGDHVVTTCFDHNATNRALAWLETNRGVLVSRVAPGSDGLVSPRSIAGAIIPATRLLVVTHASNLTGALCDLEQIGAIAAQRGIPMLVDAAATAGIVPIDVQRMNVAMLAFGAHKRLLGPGGIAVLYVRDDVALDPLRHGNVTGHDAVEDQPDVWPGRLESGTPNVIGIAAMGAAVERVLDLGWDAIAAHHGTLISRLMELLRGIAGIRLLAPDDPGKQVPIVSISIAAQPPASVASALREDFGIVVSHGLHNCPHLHRHLDTWPDGAVRLSPGEPTTLQDLDRAARAVASLLG